MSTILVRPLCSELALKAEIELNETPKKLEEGIKHLKEWIAKQPHLRARSDGQWLAAFLRTCKYSLDGAKKKIDLLYTMRSVAPELTPLKYWHGNFKEILRSGYILVLPERLDPAGPRVIIVRPFNYDPKRLHLTDALAVAQVLKSICIMDDDPFVIAGMVLILDLSDMTLSHFGQITIPLLKKILTFYQDASPMRFREAHFVGLPSYCLKMYKLCLEMLNEKNRRKVYIHKKKDLTKIIPKDILPVEYGGISGNAQEIIDHWIGKVKEFEPFLEDDLQYGTDENRRQGRPKTAELLFGVDGSFRQLDFD